MTNDQFQTAVLRELRKISKALIVINDKIEYNKLFDLGLEDVDHKQLTIEELNNEHNGNN